MRGGKLTFSCGVCADVHRCCPVAFITYTTHEKAETWICEMKYGREVVDDGRPTKENKREARGAELTFSRVSTPLATYTTHERRG